MMRAWLLVVALVLTGCTPSTPPQIRWVEAGGISGEVRDVTDCGGTWYAVGSVPGPGSTARPAGWTSTDGRIWNGLTFVPLKNSFYGPHQVITSVGCGPAGVAMVGSAPGGAHGNLRISTWIQVKSGSMAEVAAPFDTYGGDEAVNTGRVVGGPQGFIITGNRSSGAAVWQSRDGRSFQLTELKGGVARDAAPAADGSWVVVGGFAQKKTLNQAAAIWLGPRWTPATVQSIDGYNDLQRVVRLGDDIVAVGPRGKAFGSWIGHGNRWTAAGAFGNQGGDVTALSTDGTSLFALVTLGNSRGVWRSEDHAASWRRINAPVIKATAMSAHAGAVLLMIGGRVWTTALDSRP